jgi:hypothetical protein
MSKEGLPLQFDLFSGELVDTRSDYQKKKDRERTAPQQIQMFKTTEMVQFGAKPKSAYREWLDQATAPPLMLEMQETRTPEEIELDRLREAQRQMQPLFGGEDIISRPASPVEDSVSGETHLPSSGVIFDAQKPHRAIGLRTRLRAQSISVRSRSRAA